MRDREGVVKVKGGAGWSLEPWMTQVATLTILSFPCNLYERQTTGISKERRELVD